MLNGASNRRERSINKLRQTGILDEDVAGFIDSGFDKVIILLRIWVFKLDGVAIWSKEEFGVNTDFEQLVDVRREGLHSLTPVRGVLAETVEVEGEGRGIGVGCNVGRERGPRTLNSLPSRR